MIINKDQTVLDILSRYEQTIDVFRKYDHAAQACICCEALFETLENLSARYGLDLNGLLNDLNNVAKHSLPSPD
ncbi:hypothetical protein [Trichloromonas sp.]|uniref:hypothetical protein n=1 Tax=Trichloromonas sp. TaxID=3069249 RepID=UPI002A3B8161|nr:hypothetical protein [Trichloromonas sp.]